MSSISRSPFSLENFITLDLIVLLLVLLMIILVASSMFHGLRLLYALILNIDLVGKI